MKLREVRMLFNAVDKNANGLVEFGEFVEYVFSQPATPVATAEGAAEDGTGSTETTRAAPKRRAGSSSKRAASPPVDEPPRREALTRKIDQSSQIEDEGIDWTVVDRVFYDFAGRDKELAGLEFARLCRTCNLYDNKYQPCDAEAIFAIVQKPNRKMGPKEFTMALKLVADAKHVPHVALRGQVASLEIKEPIHNATRTDSRHYTGGARR